MSATSRGRRRRRTVFVHNALVFVEFLLEYIYLVVRDCLGNGEKRFRGLGLLCDQIVAKKKSEKRIQAEF